jgi:peptide/nickel transport system substrate-binding protein
MFRKNVLILSTALLIASIALGACAPATPEATIAPVEPTEAPPKPTEVAPEPTAEPVEERGTFRIAHYQQWAGKESLDPASPTRFQPVLNMIYDRLVTLDDQGMPTPCLAVSWEVDETGKKWTFRLREGVTFHDGKPFTSADVIYTYTHLLDPELEAPAASVLQIVDTERLEAPDDLTVVFNLTDPHSDFAPLLSYYQNRIIPDGSADTIGQTGIGTGPFKVESLDLEGTTVLVANDEYWDGPPGLARIEVVGIADQQARVLALLADQIDYDEDINPEQLDMFKAYPNLEIQDIPSGNNQTMVMNTTMSPFDDVRVRQALKLVADRQEIVDIVMGGHGMIACDSPVWIGDPYHLPYDCSQDIERAKELLALAGYEDGLTVELKVSDIDAFMIPIAIVYKEQAAKAGINVEINQVPSDGYWSEIWLVEPFVGGHWSQRTTDQVLNQIYTCGASWNDGYWCNEEFDQLLLDARGTMDFEERKEVYQKAIQLLVDESGTITPVFVNQIRAFNARVKGLPPVPFYEIPWHKITIEE